MDFELPPDALMLRDMLRRFVQKEAQPLEMKYFNTRTLEAKERARLRQAVEQLGLWGLTVPEEFGGGGLDMVTTCLIEEELGKTFIPLELGEAPSVLYACHGEQVSQYLEPVLAGERQGIIALREEGQSHLSPENWKTRAIVEQGGYHLSGQKILLQKPNKNDFLILYALTEEGPTVFLLDIAQPGIAITQNGNSASSATRVTFQDCYALPDAILGVPGGGLKLAMLPSGIREVERAWIKSGARYVGMAERLLVMAVEHARDWISFGAPLTVRPAVQRMVADSRVAIESARLLAYRAAWLFDQGSGQQECRASAALARLAAGSMLKQVVDSTTMIYAGPGPTPVYEPGELVWQVVPPEALENALNQARSNYVRAVIIEDLIRPPEE